MQWSKPCASRKAARPARSWPSHWAHRPRRTCCATRSRWVSTVLCGWRPMRTCNRSASPNCSRRWRNAHKQPHNNTKKHKTKAKHKQPDHNILGKQAIDSDAGQAGQMLAALLGVGQGVAISSLEVWDGEVVVTRELDGGTEPLALRLPAVVPADLRLNEPRYVKLPNLMMAKKKPIETIKASDLGIDASPRLKQLKGTDPPVRKAGSKVANAQALVEKLRIEAKVL